MSLGQAFRLAGTLGRSGTAFGPRATATAIPLLQQTAQFLGNPWGRAAVGGTIGATTNQEGTLGGRVRGALVGAGMGALPVPGAGWGQAKAASAMTGIGLNPHLAAGIAQTAIPLGLTGFAANQGRGGSSAGGVARGVQSAAGNVLGGGARALNQQGNVVSMSELPKGFSPQLERMFQGPEGNWWYNLDPGGLPAGQRLGRLLGAQTDASVMNTLGNALYGQTERVAKSELARQAAAYQLKANVDQARDMALNSQTAGLNIGQNAAQSMGDAMSNRSTFRYI